MTAPRFAAKPRRLGPRFLSRRLSLPLISLGTVLVGACGSDPPPSPPPPVLDAGPSKPDAKPRPPGPPDASAEGDGAAGSPDGLVGPTGAPAPPPIEVSYLDKSAAPCDDFYQYACGGWLQRNALGANESGRQTFTAWSTEVARIVFTTIDDDVRQGVGSADPQVASIAGFYQACMDSGKDTGAQAALRQVTALVDPVAAAGDLGVAVAELRKRGVHTFFFLYAGIDPGDATKYVLTIDQGARQLPARNYYFDADLEGQRTKYRTYIAQLSQLLGVPVDPAAVMRVETALAMGELMPAEKRDPLAIYHKMTLAEAMALAPHFPWQAHLTALAIEGITTVNVISPAALMALDQLLATMPIDDLKQYMRWQVLANKAGLLDDAVLAEVRRYRGSTSTLTPAQIRRSTCLAMTADRFPYEVGGAYVEKYCSAGTRDQAADELHQIRAAFERRIMSRAWLDEPTRAQALTKLGAVAEKVAYPVPYPSITKAQTYTTLLETDLAGSMRFSTGVVNALKASVDRTRWSSGAAPTTINAFYGRALNDITFPAAILHLPHFDPDRSRAANYGAIGFVMGHELTHGFDDQGRLYDGNGSLHSWWSPVVADEFTRRAQCVGDAFAKFEALPGQFVDPKLTMGENLADLGGVRLALDAYLHDGPRAPAYEGFSDLQQFFLASAQSRCTIFSPSLAAQLLKSDPHAPDKARVNVIFSQLPEFADAFQCPATAKMRAPQPCEVW